MKCLTILYLHYNKAMQNLSFFPLLYVTTVDLLKQHQLAAQVLYVADVHLKRRKNRICYYLCMNLFIYFFILIIFICRLQHLNCKSSVKKKINIYHTTTGLTENLETITKNEVAIVWPFVCSSFAEQCISFDGK